MNWFPDPGRGRRHLCRKDRKIGSSARLGSRCNRVEPTVRAFNPFPGAETGLDGELLKVWEAGPVEGSGSPGSVIGLDHGRPVVACGSGALALTVIQRSGSRRMVAAEFLKGRPMPPGTQLGPVRHDGA